jgi:hypothetical protein
MKIPHEKGVANHSAPNSRAAGREACREASRRGRGGLGIELRKDPKLMNHSNPERTSSTENAEGRPLINENTPPPHTPPTQSGARVSQGLAGVRKAAKEHQERRFTALLHHLTVGLLRESFRRGRSQHQALDALSYALTQKRVNYVVDADIRAFLDTISHAWMLKFVQHRVADRRILRLIQKWLKAGGDGGRPMVGDENGYAARGR